MNTLIYVYEAKDELGSYKWKAMVSVYSDGQRGLMCIHVCINNLVVSLRLFIPTSWRNYNYMYNVSTTTPSHYKYYNYLFLHLKSIYLKIINCIYFTCYMQKDSYERIKNKCFLIYVIIIQDKYKKLLLSISLI